MRSLLSIGLALFSTVAFAAKPVITSTSISDPLVEGEYIINGSNFGAFPDENTNNDFLPATWEDFDDGLIGGRGVERVNEGPRRGQNFGRAGSTYHAECYKWSTAVTYTNLAGGQSTATKMHGMKVDGPGVGVNSKKIFHSAWLMLPANFQENISLDPGDQSKVMMLSPSNNNNKTVITLFYDFTTHTEDGQLGRRHGDINDLLPPYEWRRIDIWTDVPSQIRVYIDGKLIRGGGYELSDITFSTAGWCQYQFTGSNTNTWIQYIDDLYHSTTRARVEISPNSTWNETDYVKKELQIPLEWSDNQIRIRLNTGGLNITGPLYVYVINDNGEVSDAWPVGAGTPPPDPDPDPDPPPVDPPVDPNPPTDPDPVDPNLPCCCGNCP